MTAIRPTKLTACPSAAGLVGDAVPCCCRWAALPCDWSAGCWPACPPPLPFLWDTAAGGATTKENPSPESPTHPAGTGRATRKEYGPDEIACQPAGTVLTVKPVGWTPV